MQKGKMMIKFDENEAVNSVQGALALRPQIEKIVDQEMARGVKNISWIGIGGTWASAKQVHVHMKERSALDTFVTNAAEYLTTGDRRIGEGTLAVLSSVSGTTSEMVAAVDKLHAAGARVFAFIDTPGTTLTQMADDLIIYEKNEQLKFFMTAEYFMYKAGEFPDYQEYYSQLDANLAKDLADVEKAADSRAEAFAEKAKDNKLTYFVGAGNLYGATYSYAMCYWEEMHWMRTKSIHAAEFFHGMLEIIDEDTPVVVLQGEDSQRPLTERVIRFLDKINKNHTVIDSRDYPMPGIDEKYRGSIAHLIVHAVTNRIDAYLEQKMDHDMSIRRYYRKVEY